MANMLIMFGLMTFATKGVSFGAIEMAIPKMIMPKIGKFPTIILWAVAAVAIMYFVWNKTRLGKNMYAVGGNPEAAAATVADAMMGTQYLDVKNLAWQDLLDYYGSLN